MLLAAGPVHATQFFQVDVADPFSEATCPANKVMSFGSYIYDAPSKFDGVFWPATTEQWLWFCPQSGYAALGSDFEKLSPPESDALRTVLAEHYDPAAPPEGPLARLQWMERLYGVRAKDQEFWAYFYRLAAYWHDSEGDAVVANEYRAQALPLLESIADASPPGPKKIQHLFLAGEYHRQLEREERALEYFAKAAAVVWTDKNGEETVSIPYYTELISQRRAEMGRRP